MKVDSQKLLVYLAPQWMEFTRIFMELNRDKIPAGPNHFVMSITVIAQIYMSNNKEENKK